MNNIKISASGKYLPNKKIDNNELEEKLNLEKGYIVKRTGIENRYYSIDEKIEDMAIKAIQNLQKGNDVDLKDIGLIICATTSSYNLMPTISNLVQKNLDLNNCICLDILAGCAGFINALDIAKNYIQCGKIEKALVIGVDILSKYINETDIGTSIIFSDGAGAVLIEKTTEKKLYISNIESNAQRCDILTCKSNEKIYMDGIEVYKYAVTETVKSIEKLLEKANEKLENIKYIVPHQSNLKIIKSIANKLKVDMSKVFVNINNVGNTFCASIPIAISEMQEKNMLKKGDKIILLGYGGGLNTASILIEI